jgi:hypothetical protein
MSNRFSKSVRREPGVWESVTSLSLLVCKNVEFQKLDLKLSASEIIKDVFYFSPSLKS